MTIRIREIRGQNDPCVRHLNSEEEEEEDHQHYQQEQVKENGGHSFLALFFLFVCLFV